MSFREIQKDGKMDARDGACTAYGIIDLWVHIWQDEEKVKLKGEVRLALLGESNRLSGY